MRDCVTKCAQVNTTLIFPISLSLFVVIGRFLDERHFNFCASLASAHVILMSYLISTQGQALLE